MIEEAKRLSELDTLLRELKKHDFAATEEVIRGKERCGG